MYHVFAPQSSFLNFLHQVRIVERPYVFVMLTFTGSYSSLLSKTRYLHEGLQEHIPLFVVDVRMSPQILHHLTQAFPTIVANKKLPMHLCFAVSDLENHGTITLQPLFANYTTLTDQHFKQLNGLVTK